MQPDGGWTTPEVAEAQYELVERELAILEQASTHRDNWGLLDEPYVPFLAALSRLALPDGSRLLDAGCGVGHYGTVCRELGLGIEYTGSDFSRHMIDIARRREPTLTFLVRWLLANAIESFDCVLLSQCVEVMDDPPFYLGNLLYRAKRQAVILHRLRLGHASGRITEPTYAGHMGTNWLWSRAYLEALLADHRRRYEVIDWTRPDMLTMVLWPQT